ncbi:MAG: hypothetical protein WEC75_02075 [Dehalococcoidia bacterium]
MSRFRWLLVAALCVGVFSFAAGCGGSDDDDADGDAPQATAPAGDGGDDGDGGDGGDGGDSGDLREVGESFVDATFTVTYNVSGGGAELGISQMTMYKDGQDRFRFDSTSTEAGEETSFSFISNGDTGLICFAGGAGLGAVFGVESDEGVCIENNDAVPIENPFSGLAADVEDLSGLEVLDTSEREIAGRSAKCYRTRDTTTSEETEACFDDGILLYVSTPGDGFSLEATEASGEVSDSDFEAPYEITDVPALGQ